MPFAKSKDVNIYFTESGSGDAIIFCHGIGGNSTVWWQQFGHFCSDYHCIAIDHRGFGRSTCRAEQFDPRSFGDDAVAVLDAAGISSAHFVCQSMGGWTGVQAALKYPERVRSLTLSGTIGGFNLPSGLHAAATVKERIAAGTASTLALASDFPQRQPALSFLFAEIGAFNTSLAGFDPVPRLVSEEVLVPLATAAELNMPILMVAGEYDLIWGADVIKELQGYLPRSRLVEVKAGHSPYFETPIEFNEILGDFLRADVE